MLAGRLNDTRLLAVPKIVIREMLNFPELAQMYRREVLDRAVPVVIGLIERGIAKGYLRPVDAELTVRSIIGPLMLHLLLAEAFGMQPADGLAMDRLIENHLSILFDGMAQEPAK